MSKVGAKYFEVMVVYFEVDVICHTLTILIFLSFYCRYIKQR